MKIAMVCHKYYPDIGGVETHVREISERLINLGFDVDVICTDPLGKYSSNDYYNGVKITRFKSFGPKNAFYFSPQILFKKIDADIIHLHNYHAFPALFGSFGKKRIIFTPHYHGGSSSSLRNFLLRPYKLLSQSIYNRAEKVICVSENERQKVINDFNISEKKVVVIPNGLNMEEFREVSYRKTETETETDETDETKIEMKNMKTILYAGRLERYKGIQYIINALPLLEDYRLEIIGKGSYEKELYKLAKRLNVNDRINWFNNIDRREFLSHFRSADVFVNLSRFEAYGITVAESLASGTPCVIAKGGPLEEFIKEDDCVGISYPIDIKVLAHIINGMKRSTPRIMMDWKDVTSELVKIYLRRNNE